MNQAGESRPGSFYGVKIPARSERMVRARSETHLLPDLCVGFMDAFAARADRISQAREFRRNTFCSSTFLLTRARASAGPPSGASRCARDGFRQSAPDRRASSDSGAAKLALRNSFLSA